MSEPIRDPATDPAPEVLTAEEATGASRGTGMSTMLAVSLILVVVVLFGLYFLFGARVNHASGPTAQQTSGGQSGTSNAAAANTFNAPEPAPKPAPVNGTAGAANQQTPH